MKDAKRKWTEPSATELKSKKLTDNERCTWGYFINDDGEIEYTNMCEKCERECKQSFRAKVIYCKSIADKKKGRCR